MFVGERQPAASIRISVAVIKKSRLASKPNTVREYLSLSKYIVL